MRVLVDDDPAIRRRVKAGVAHRPGFQVIGEASTGQEALSLVRIRVPDIVVTDYALDGSSGVDLALAFDLLGVRLTTILYTSCESEEVVLAALQAGIRAYVLKSDDIAPLLDALDSVAAGHSYFSGTVLSLMIQRLRGDESRHPPLTRRQTQVVRMIGEGRTNREIADCLRVSQKTVETHRTKAMSKLKLGTTADLVRYALRNGLVSASFQL